MSVFRDEDSPPRAPPGRQLAAAAFDWTILLVEPVALTAYVSSIVWTGGGPGGNWTPIFIVIGGGVPWTFLVAIMQLVFVWRKRRTLGQKLLGLRVVCRDGGRAGLLPALIARSLGWLLALPLGVLSGMYVWYPIFGEPSHTLEALLAFLTFFAIAYAPCLVGDRRTLGDRIAGTSLSMLGAPPRA